MTEEQAQSVQPRRSFIFAPGLRPELYPKALASGADIVCVELEDGIAPHDKDEAREKTLALFTEPQADMSPRALMLPKVVSPDEVVWLDDLLTERGHDTRLHIIIEMNAGLEAVFDIARSSARIDALFFGGVDMAADLRCKNAWEPLLYARSRVVHAAASVGVDAVDVPYLDLEDLEGMKIQARQARDLGFSGKGAIHPKQIADLNEVFTPSAEEVARARKVVAAFEDANTGLVVVDGKLIEKPVVREMQRILSVADRAGR